MKKIVTLFAFILTALVVQGQYYSGYYVSDPQVHSFHHFKIKQEKDESKIYGDLVVRAYCDDRQLWEQKATLVADSQQADYLVDEYGQGKEIVSLHFLKFLWDGNEWEYFLLGYLGEDKHRHFVVVEEIFNDETETQLIELNMFDWVKGHHIRPSTGR